MLFFSSTSSRIFDIFLVFLPAKETFCSERFFQLLENFRCEVARWKNSGVGRLAEGNFIFLCRVERVEANEKYLITSRSCHRILFASVKSKKFLIYHRFAAENKEECIKDLQKDFGD